ncbi:unnamed protein product [Brachionus calyciflorus]|uniref:Uncharacterized protein n=1 Tax=Brachionus calyciflorus TaxID=104777 RepID=A0A813RJT3_9BILA|nr:unnamed protein product [Brachionus calyciflorus]
MKGEYKGLAARVRLEASTALHIHCYAHRLNLALQDSGENIKEVLNTLGQVNSVLILLKVRTIKKFLIYYHRAFINILSKQFQSIELDYKHIKELG